MTQRGWWLGLVVAFLVVFAPVLRHDFILLDDDQHLFSNPAMLNPSIEKTFEFWKKPYFGLYVPVTYTVWAVEASFAKPGKNQISAPLMPWVFHLGNILFHAANTALVALILYLLFSSEWAALFGSALFALHPIQIETVSWAAGRRDLLAAFFSLVALWQLLIATKAPDRWRRHFTLATFLYVLALLSKPSAAPLCAVAPLLLWAFNGKLAKDLLAPFFGWALLAIPIFAVTRSQQPLSMLDFIPTFFQRVLVAFDALWFYVAKIAFPWTLAIDYARNPEWVLEQRSWTYAIGGLFFLLAAAVVAKASQKIWAFSFMFVAVLAPVLGLIPFAFQKHTTVADHYAYFALFAVALGLAQAVVSWNSEKVRHVITAALALLCVRSVGYVPKWSDSQTMFLHNINAYPRSQIANNNLGFVREKQGELSEALRYYRQALAIHPLWADTLYNVGNILAKQGQYEEAEKVLREALKQKPDHSDAAHVLGGVLMNTGRVEESIAHLAKAIEVRPQHAPYYAKYGAALTTLQKFEEAIQVFDRALALNPASVESYNNKGVTLQRLGRNSEAIDAFASAMRVNDTYLPAKGNLARLLQSQDRCSEAVSVYASMLKQLGDNPEINAEIAKCLSKMGRVEDALTVVKALLKSNPSSKGLAKESQRLTRMLASGSKKNAKQ